MKKLFSFIPILLLALSLSAQTTNSIIQKISQADSVVLISHILTREFGPIIKYDTEVGNKKSKPRPPQRPPFLKNGKINRKIIVEATSLRSSGRLNLITILSRKEILREIKMMQCDLPRHSIIIYKNNKQSYIDICFGCKRINKSKDLQFSEIGMDDEKWEELQKFFMASGIKKLYNVFD
jgi:hypothetical protein